MTSASLTLVLGGARSGKSVFAEQRLACHDGEKIYVATAQAWDDEMRERIDVHKARRGSDWTTVDAPLELFEALSTHARASAIVLVDCLTLWLNNLLMAERDIGAECDALARGLKQLDGPVVLVSNEVGSGIVPENALARRFRDAQGRLNQQIAAVADDVFLVAAGLPLTLKSSART